MEYLCRGSSCGAKDRVRGARVPDSSGARTGRDGGSGQRDAARRRLYNHVAQGPAPRSLREKMNEQSFLNGR